MRPRTWPGTGSIPVENGVDFFANRIGKIRTDQKYWRHRGYAWVGDMESGKSTAARWIADFVIQTFGESNVHCIQSNDFLALLDNIHPEKKVQVLFLDDAVTQHDSRRSMSTSAVRSTQTLYMIRHEFKRVTNHGGATILLLGYQHYSAVDVRFRESMRAIFLKSWYDEHSQFMQNFFGPGSQKYKEELRFIDQQIYDEYDDNAKLLAIGKTKTGRYVEVGIHPDDFIPEEDTPFTEVAERDADPLFEEWIRACVEEGLREQISIKGRILKHGGVDKPRLLVRLGELAARVKYQLALDGCDSPESDDDDENDDEPNPVRKREPVQSLYRRPHASHIGIAEDLLSLLKSRDGEWEGTMTDLWEFIRPENRSNNPRVLGRLVSNAQRTIEDAGVVIMRSRRLNQSGNFIRTLKFKMRQPRQFAYPAMSDNNVTGHV